MSQPGKPRAFSDEVDAGSSQKMRPNKKQAFSDEVDTGSLQKMRPNQKARARSHRHSVPA